MEMNNQLDKSKKKKGRRKEILLLVIVFIVIIAVFQFFCGRDQENGNVVIVTVDGEEYGRYLLNENQTVDVKIDGEVTNYLIIQDGAADMVEANCPDQLCVNMKSISLDGETIVCLPNKAVVEIESNEQPDLDVTAQ